MSFCFCLGCPVPLGKVVIVLVPTGNPPLLRFGHPDVTFGRYRLFALELAGLPVELCGCGRVFRMRPQGVSPDALRCGARRKRSVRVTGAPA